MAIPPAFDIRLPSPKLGPQESSQFPEVQTTSSPSYYGLSKFPAETHVDGAVVMRRSFELHLSFDLVDAHG
jgi:hypothetical protein